MQRFRLNVWGLSLVIASMAIKAEAQRPAPIAFDQLLTPDQLKQAGLEHLSRAELDSLNAFVWRFSMAIAQIAPHPSQPAASPTLDHSQSPSAIESRIDGEFTGWQGETIFKLINGQIWQQASYNYAYHYSYNPKVLIYSSDGIYRMRVDGVDGEIAVRRLK